MKVVSSLENCMYVIQVVSLYTYVQGAAERTTYQFRGAIITKAKYLKHFDLVFELKRNWGIYSPPTLPGNYSITGTLYTGQ